MMDDPSIVRKRGRDNKYKQVYLGQNGHRLVGWIENRMAIKGKRITVEGYTGIWDIITVFTDVIVDDDIEILTDEYRHHRKRTDI